MRTADESLELPSYRTPAEQEIHDRGVAALQTLIPQCEQNATIREFLLGMYDGKQFPFDLTRLRGLDAVDAITCLKVLQMDALTPWYEVHQYVHGGTEMFRRWSIAATRPDPMGEALNSGNGSYRP